MKGYIYLYTHRKSETEIKYYVGQTIHLVRRQHEHRKARGNFYFDKAVKKYGYEAFEFSILEEIDLPTKAEVKTKLDELEIYYITKYNSISNGYNIKPGGKSNKSEFDSDALEKMSSAAKLQWSNLEFKEKRSKEMKDLWKSDKYRNKVSKGVKAAWKSKEYRDNIIEKRKEMWRDPEFREKMKNIKKSPKRGIQVMYTDLNTGFSKIYESISKLIRDENLKNKNKITEQLKLNKIYKTNNYKLELIQ